MSFSNSPTRSRRVDRRRKSVDNFSISSSTKRDKSLGRLGCSLSYKSSGNDSYEITSPTLKSAPIMIAGTFSTPSTT